MLYFREQCGFVYTESFKLLPDFLLLRLADNIRFIVEVEYCWLAFVTVYAIKEESSRFGLSISAFILHMMMEFLNFLIFAFFYMPNDLGRIVLFGKKVF